ncbi:uncharacterized protein LOC122536603 [Frieseomelitta varia]|uniref:uncharacterized protein LOC122536603 n=1 Tax=Frieseomelitta varia TaxID=561572 RepID=UPI001CB69B4A|nr:uncharacterized protein LOC122536603 [Frieseomelitta varia]
MFIFAPRDNMSTSRQDSTGRRSRYARSSTTTSVTQLLSDSCSNLLQRLTTRVRGMSTVNDNVSNNKPVARRSPIVTQLNSARARIEDKYSAILDKYSRKKHQDRADRPSVDYRRTRERDRDHAYFRREDSPFVRDEKTLEPSMSRTVIKSPTSVILSEKAYPYVKSSTTVKEFKREKTPGYHRADKQHSLLNSDTCRRYGRHKSGHAETRTRKVRPYRNGKSEQLESSSSSAALRLARPMKVEPLASKARNDDDDEDPDKTPTSSVHGDNANDNGVVLATIDTTEEETDPAISERAAKRKEIESLILKYAAMEETYAQLAGGGGQAKMRPSTTDIIASKYRKSARQSERKDALKSAMAASVVNNHADTAQNAIVSCRTAGF